MVTTIGSSSFSMASISIIIPVLNEEAYIEKLLRTILKHSTSNQIKEILVVDGGSTDNTLSIAKKFGVKTISCPSGRAKQMNIGAQKATGEILYFLHVDSLPPLGFDQKIVQSYNEGYKTGCFRLKFDTQSYFLGFFAWFTKINQPICRGGDQSLFITKELFKKLKGFNEEFVIYEDNEFIRRIYKVTSFKVIDDFIETSTRRYKKHGNVRLQYHFAMIHLKYYLGSGPQTLFNYYKKHIAL